MTIAACLVTTGGVVFGADSTTTFVTQGHDGSLVPTPFDYAQKLFEVGEESSIGVVTWGLGAFDNVSYRGLVAQLADDLGSSGGPASVRAAVDRLVKIFWARYSDPSSSMAAPRAQAAELATKTTPEALAALANLQQGTQAGFCLGGHLESRECAAYCVVFSPEQTTPPTPDMLPVGTPHFWGVPNIIKRVALGIDPQAAEQVLASPHWTGTRDDLVRLLSPFALRAQHGILPIREAIDYVHAVVSMTCKGVKFSHWPNMCGGTVETAVITADRRFRWVTHKTMGEAL